MLPDFTAGHQEKWAVSQCPERSHVAAVLGRLCVHVLAWGEL